MLIREINKYIKQNCAPSWAYLRDYTGMHGQQNISLHCMTAIMSVCPITYSIYRLHICAVSVQ